MIPTLTFLAHFDWPGVVPTLYLSLVDVITSTDQYPNVAWDPLFRFALLLSWISGPHTAPFIIYLFCSVSLFLASCCHSCNHSASPITFFQMCSALSLLVFTRSSSWGFTFVPILSEWPTPRMYWLEFVALWFFVVWIFSGFTLVHIYMSCTVCFPWVSSKKICIEWCKRAEHICIYIYIYIYILCYVGGGGLAGGASLAGFVGLARRAP